MGLRLTKWEALQDVKRVGGREREREEKLLSSAAQPQWLLASRSDASLEQHILVLVEKDVSFIGEAH